MSQKRKSLEIVNYNKRLDVTTAEDKFRNGSLSDSEKKIIADMRVYMEDARKRFELITNMKKAQQPKVTQEVIKTPVEEHKSWFKKIFQKITNIF